MCLTSSISRQQGRKGSQVSRKFHPFDKIADQTNKISLKSQNMALNAANTNYGGLAE